MYPKHLGDLFAGQTINVVGRFTGEAKGTAFVKARLGSRLLRIPIRVRFPKTEVKHDALRPLWARYKIEDLMGVLRNSVPQEQNDLVQEITDLAVQFRLVSQYTAFVAVDASRVVGNGKPLRVLQPVEMPEGVSFEGVFGAAPVGQAMSVAAWGVTLVRINSGKIAICKVDPGSVSDQSGLRAGMILKTVNRTVVQDLQHLEGLLLQSSGNVSLEIDGQGEIVLPAP